MVNISPTYSHIEPWFNGSLVFLLQTILIASSSEINHAQNLTKLLTDFILTCGSSETFCNTSHRIIQKEPAITPECAKSLKCDQSCALGYSCSPDAQFAFIDVSCIETNIYNPLKMGYPSYQYNMIAKCGIFTSSNIGRKTDEEALCTDLPDITMNNLHDDVYRPVIASGSQITYRNVHCAICNGEADHDIVPFELNAECYSQFDINSFNTLHEAWDAIYQNNCSIVYKPPYEFINDITECPKQGNMISHCNTTGLWSIEEYAPQIEWACEHFKSLTYKKHYKNIYCYICNPSLVSKHYTELISSCNTTDKVESLDEAIESGCMALPEMPRMSPYKNVFCRECNGVHSKSINYAHVERQFEDVGIYVNIYSFYDFNPLNGVKRAYTEFKELRFESTETDNEISKVNADVENFAYLSDAINELGKFCGLEDMCLRPFKQPDSYFGNMVCNFPCVEGSSCCSMVSLGVNPGTSIALNLSLPVANLNSIYNLTRTFEQRQYTTYTTSTVYNHLTVIASCNAGNVLKQNISKTFQDKCEQLNHGDILEYIPVTSIHTKLDYRNIYCARCNGELGTLNAYTFTAECGTIIEADSAASFAGINEIISKENCKIKIEMPFNECRNDPECVHKCPTNDMNSNYPAHIRYLCESADLMNAMFEYFKVNHKLYKNVFCFMCNVQWNISEGSDVITRCNETGHWDYKGNTSMMEILCETTPFHPVWYHLGYKNIFCAECNVKAIWFYILLAGKGGLSCGVEGFACIVQESAYRSAFSISISPPSEYSDSEDKSREAVDFCAAGKTIVDETCRPVLENTVDLQFDLKLELDIVESLIEKNIATLTLLESVRQQIPGLIKHNISDAVHFSAVTVSGYSPCVDTLTGENFTIQEITNTIENGYPIILLEADIVVDYTLNRSRLENDLMNLRNNATFAVLVETGYVSLISHPHNIPSLCVQSGMVRNSKVCTISEFDSENKTSDRMQQLNVNKLLTCILRKLPGEDIILKEICTKRIPFYFDTDDSSLVVCKSDALILRYTIVKAAQIVQHSVTKLSIVHAIFSLVCTCLSLLCLAITFVTYCLFKCIRTLPGINNMNLALTLFGAQIFTQFGIWLTEHEGRCIILGVITHYFWLCTFCAMNICSFHMFKVFTSAMYTSQNQSKWVTVKYCLYVYVMPVFIILTYIVVKVSLDGSHHLGYGGAVCFLSELIPVVAVLFSPAIAIIIANFIFSILAYRRIRYSPHVQSNLERNDFKIYVKLLTVTGVAWPLMFIDSVLPLTAFSFIATFANALQGVFIFIAFICNKKVFDLYKKFEICGLGHPQSITVNRRKKNTSGTAM